MKHSLQNKWLALVLALLLIVGVLPFGALASSGETPIETAPIEAEATIDIEAEVETEAETETETEVETETEAAETSADPAQATSLALEGEEESVATKIGRVRVIVENTTFTEETGGKKPAWTGTLVDKWVDLMSDSTMMSCLVEALGTYTQTGAESNYISEIGGLSAYDGGSMSGWMGTLNDWFANEGFDAFTVKDGTLENGDEIRLLYTCDWGADIGSDWSSTDKGVKALAFSTGTLAPAFDKATTDYTLTVPAGTSGLTVTPTAANKNYQVRSYVGTTEYKRSDSIPVADGTVITVKCGDPAWPSMNTNTGEAQIYTITVREAAAAEKPESITIEYAGDRMMGGKLVGQSGDQFAFRAVDQNGNETPVTWSTTSSWIGSIDADTGVLTVSSCSGYLYLNATSTLDETIAAKNVKFEMATYAISNYQKNQTVALSTDGQSTKTASVTGGVKEYSVWSCDIPEGIATLAADPGDGNSIKFNCLRPGSISVKVAIKGFEAEMFSEATVTITGVAVEDTSGAQGETRLEMSKNAAAPTAQLTAYVQEGRSVASWSSANESVATVDENGVVTGHKLGSTIITATDSEGSKGGIKVIVTDADTPYFESLELQAMADWKSGQTFQPETLEYSAMFKLYSTSTLTLSTATVYNTEKYTAEAKYVDADGESVTAAVNSRAITMLKNLPFDETDVTITLSDKADPSVKTDYVFHITRPRDTNKTIKSNGIVLVPDGRSLLAAKYEGQPEGTMFRLDESGEPTGTTGINAKAYAYQCYLLDGTKKFALTLSGNTNYTHLRYSTDGGETWTETAQGGGTTAVITAPEGGVTVLVQIIDDKTYVEKGMFDAADCTQYSVKVVPVDVSLADAYIRTAECGGDWYPAFDPTLTSYTIVQSGNTGTVQLRYTAAEGASVKLGTTEQTADEDGVYTLELKTTAQTLTVVSADGALSNAYSFQLGSKKAGAPDKVVDYLCIGSQYTNSGYGQKPEGSLNGTLKSLGNFGGYITYYYENAITDDPNNLYGVDFYVYGNSFADGGSAAEPGQVYVSADGVNWYALAGSEHYEDKTIWDYTITYTKGADGKAHWTDNQGNTMGNSATAWPSHSIYYFNDVWSENSYSFTGVLLKSQQGTVMGDSSTGADSYAAATSFGYADYYKNGTLGTDVNPYAENPTMSNGFDLAWAVDAQGNPVQLDAIHYIRVATASNIWAGNFCEKSTEITSVLRTTAQSEPVGKTALPSSITLSDESGSKTVKLSDGQQIYTVGVGSMSAVSVTVNGAAEDANVYINNQRVAAGTASQTFAIPAEGTKLVRVIVQEGDKEPVVLLLKIAGGTDPQDAAKAADVDALIDAIGSVTAESSDKITAAREAYDALDEAQKALVTGLAALEAAESAYSSLCYESIYQAAGDYIASLDPGSFGSEWYVLGLGRAGRNVNEAYYAAVKQYVSENADENGRLSATKVTENARVILALTAIGHDARDVGGVDLVAGMDEMSYVTKQGINGSVYALLALDSHNYEPQGDVTREALISEILNKQLAGGGWTFFGSSADPDLTGMALQALAPYYKNGNEAVDTAVDAALTALSAMQSADGGFASWGSVNCESCAQVLTALTALGIDPTTDARFVKNGKNPVDGLCAFAVEGGGFRHALNGKLNAMATQQGYYALVSYFRLKAGQTGLYNMSDVVIKGDSALAAEEKAAAVEALIDAIGEVTADSKAAIEAARAAYDALSDEEKTLVRNYALLTAAERRLASLDPQGGTAVIGTGSTKLVLDGVTYMVDAEAASLMQRIANLRDAGGTDDEAIVEAYRTYDAMSRELKVQVFNFADLEALCQSLGVRGHRDEESGFAAEGLPWYVALAITPITDGEDHDIVAGSIGHNELLALWNIAFVNRLTGEPFTPYDTVTLRVAAPEMDEALESFRMALYSLGRVEYADCTVENGELAFAVTEGGVYGFIGGAAAATQTLAEEVPAEEPVEEAVAEAEAPEAEIAELPAQPEPESAHTLLWLWIAIGVIGVGILAVVVVLKRNNHKAKHAVK